MSEDILTELENQLKEIEENDNELNSTNENIVIREKTLGILYGFFPNMKYEKFTKDGHVFINFYFQEWIYSHTSLIFYFCEKDNNDSFIHDNNKGKILSMLVSDLPNITPKYRTVCDYDDSYLKKKEEIKEYVERSIDFVERYSYMLKIKDKINEKYSENGSFHCCFDYDNNPAGNFFFFGYIPNIGNFHFNMTHEKIIIFAIQKGMSKKLFNIHAKKEDKAKWRDLKHLEITPFIRIKSKLNESFNTVYEKIEESIRHALTINS